MFVLLHTGGCSAGLGLRLADNQGAVIPEASVFLLHDFITDKRQVTSTFLGGGNAFPTQGIDPAKTSYQFALGLTTQKTSHLKLQARYELTCKTHFQSHAGYLQAYYLWD